MKKISLLFIIASFVLASKIDINKINENFDFCKLQHKKVDVYIKGPFGKQKKTISLLKEYEDYFFSHLDNPKVQKALILLKIQAFVYDLNNFSFKRLMSSSKIDLVYKISFFKSGIQMYISMGYLPSTFRLNVANLETKKSKLSVIYSTVDLGMNLAFYLFPDDIEKAIYRNLLFDGYVMFKGTIFLTDNCSKLPTSTFTQSLLVLSVLAKKKDPTAIKILYYLANKNYNELDKFLLKNKKINSLMKYATNIIKSKYSNKLK